MHDAASCFHRAGRLLLALAEWLCEHRETDERAKRVVDGMQLFLLPSINPDGFERHQRGNGRRVGIILCI